MSEYSGFILVNRKTAIQHILDPNNMEFFSPNFPNLYPNNVNCAHYIEGKSKENI
jgi:hypothetical protein